MTYTQGASRRHRGRHVIGTYRRGNRIRFCLQLEECLESCTRHEISAVRALSALCRNDSEALTHAHVPARSIRPNRHTPFVTLIKHCTRLQARTALSLRVGGPPEGAQRERGRVRKGDAGASTSSTACMHPHARKEQTYLHPRARGRTACGRAGISPAALLE